MGWDERVRTCLLMTTKHEKRKDNHKDARYATRTKGQENIGRTKMGKMLRQGRKVAKINE